MRWEDVDLDVRTWTIPPEMTKAGRLHIVPLPPAAVAILKALPRKTIRTKSGLDPSPFVFTVSGESPLSGYSVIKRRLDRRVADARKAAGLEDVAPWTIHDLRRTVATETARLGASRFVVGQLLNHADRSVTAIYDRHGYLPEKRAALEAWASYLESLNRPAVVEAVEADAAA
jgi:integrase